MKICKINVQTSFFIQAMSFQTKRNERLQYGAHDNPSLRWTPSSRHSEFIIAWVLCALVTIKAKYIDDVHSTLVSDNFLTFGELSLQCWYSECVRCRRYSVVQRTFYCKLVSVHQPKRIEPKHFWMSINHGKVHFISFHFDDANSIIIIVNMTGVCKRKSKVKIRR